MDLEITSIRVERRGNHDHCSVFINGALSGELVLAAGTSKELVVLMMHGFFDVEERLDEKVVTYRARDARELFAPMAMPGVEHVVAWVDKVADQARERRDFDDLVPRLIRRSAEVALRVKKWVEANDPTPEDRKRIRDAVDRLRVEFEKLKADPAIAGIRRTLDRSRPEGA